MVPVLSQLQHGRYGLHLGNIVTGAALLGLSDTQLHTLPPLVIVTDTTAVCREGAPATGVIENE